jgi:hypothetical protein
MNDRRQDTEILVWLAAAFLVLALVNVLSNVVPLVPPRIPEYVFNLRGR